LADGIPLQVNLLEPGMAPVVISSDSAFASVESGPASPGLVPGFVEAFAQGVGQVVVVSNPNPFPVGIVVSNRAWGFGFNTARAVGLHSLFTSLTVLSNLAPDDDDVVSKRRFSERTPDSCRESLVQTAGKLQGGSLSPFFIVRDPANSGEFISTGEFRLGTCPGVPAVVPALDSLFLGGAGATAEVSIPQPSSFGPASFVQGGSTMLTVTTVGLAGMPFTASLTELVIMAHSPVDLIVTDPNGRRIGFDPVRARYVAEIPGGEYSGHGSEPQTVVVPMPAAGTYSIQAIGTGTGPYSISVQSLDQLGNVLSQNSFTGTAVPGSANTMTTPLTAAGILGGADTIPPVTTASPAPSPNAAGWNNTNVTINLSAVDNPGGSGVKQISFSLRGAQAGSGVVGGSNASVSISAEGVTTLTYFATDNAGNAEAPKTQVVRIDKTPPIVSATVTPRPNAAGWNNTNVTVTFAATDSLSGVASVSDPVTVTAEGKGQVIRGTARDVAGNSASASVTLNIDKTPPELLARCAPPAGSPLVAGRDSLSGIASVALTGSASVKQGEFKARQIHRILDRAGNSLDVGLQVKTEGHETRFGLISLSYNGATPALAPEENELECEFALAKAGGVKELEQRLELERQGIEVRAKFDGKKNRTIITVKRRDVEQRAVSAGLVFVGLTTNRGALGFTFTDAAGTIVVPTFGAKMDDEDSRFREEVLREGKIHEPAD